MVFIRNDNVKIIITVLIIGIFCRGTEQIDPFWHDSHAVTVFNCIDLIINHLVHLAPCPISKIFCSQQLQSQSIHPILNIRFVNS